MRYLILMVVFLASVTLNGLALASWNITELNKLAKMYTVGEYAKAVVGLKKYLTKYPDDSIAWIVLGHVPIDELIKIPMLKQHINQP